MRISVPLPFEAEVEVLGPPDPRSPRAVHSGGDVMFGLTYRCPSGSQYHRSVLYADDGFRPLVFSHPGPGWTAALIGDADVAFDVITSFVVVDSGHRLFSEMTELREWLREARTLRLSLSVMES